MGFPSSILTFLSPEIGFLCCRPHLWSAGIEGIGCGDNSKGLHDDYQRDPCLHSLTKSGCERPKPWTLNLKYLKTNFEELLARPPMRFFCLHDAWGVCEGGSGL